MICSSQQYCLSFNFYKYCQLNSTSTLNTIYKTIDDPKYLYAYLLQCHADDCIIILRIAMSTDIVDRNVLFTYAPRSIKRETRDDLRFSPEPT